MISGIWIAVNRVLSPYKNLVKKQGINSPIVIGDLFFRLQAVPVTVNGNNFSIGGRNYLGKIPGWWDTSWHHCQWQLFRLINKDILFFESNA